MTSLGGSVASVVGVTHMYGKTRSLDHVSLELPSGCMVGLIGPDGVGKSTLMGLVAGARKIQTGEINVLGGNMADARHRNAICPRIAYMPQGLGKNLYAELSVFENLDFFGRLFGQPDDERCERISILLKATGLNPFYERPAGKLSGGMKQKLGLCCALIHDPDFLILDEPTTGVDPLSRRQFWNLIDQIRAERPEMSVLVSTAYMDEAERFDWLVAMDEGKKLATGSPDDLKKQTDSESLEEAFIALLPKEKRGGKRKLIIPERTTTGEEPVIVAKGLTRRFGNFTAVNNVNFSIERGEIFGFLGSNGCGKTTTMKMLTGLLPPSEGEAWLFGKQAKAHNLETRKRVGYMSQSFSLYGELTVLQNLLLHARLFHLSQNGMMQRINDLIHRFGLEQHIDQLPEKIPLGMRQRLSLAVAIIHQPEMLILDEPTSGVDPVARDDFWELLIDLSRNEKVTIFISTHFMNEAMRCDRISLMNAGKVLACDTPEALKNTHGATNLEEAFINYIQEAADEIENEVGEVAISPDKRRQKASNSSAESKPKLSRLNLGRLLAYSYREALELSRDPIRLAFAFTGTMFLMLIFGYGITMDVENLRYAALDLDQTPESRAYLESFTGSRYFKVQPPLKNPEDLQERLRRNDITLAIEIPPHFGRELKRRSSPQVSAWIDGSMPSRAEIILGYVGGVHRNYMLDLGRRTLGDEPKLLPADIETRFRYNPSFESIYAMVPSLMGTLLFLIPAILMAVSVVREKELGSIYNFYVTPVTRIEFLLGKQLPYILIAMVNCALLVLMAIIIFDVPLKGSLFAFLLGALLYVSVTTGFGLLVSTFTKTQAAAILTTTILCMLPTVQYSGMLQPVSTLEGTAKFIGTMWPATYFMHISVGAFTKALTMKDLLADLTVLTICLSIFTMLSIFMLKKQDR